MINTSALNLSKLSRGKGENKGSYIQVIYDDKDINDLNYTQAILNNSIKYKQQIKHSLSSKLTENRKLNLPKTFSTRKGPLVLFSEDFSNSNHFIEDVKTNLKNTQPKTVESLRTFGDLRKSILEFGLNELGSSDLERQNTLDYLNYFREKNLLQLRDQTWLLSKTVSYKLVKEMEARLTRKPIQRWKTKG